MGCPSLTSVAGLTFSHLLTFSDLVAVVNLVITLFRIHGVTRFAEETRRCAQDPRHALDLWAFHASHQDERHSRL